MNEAAEGAARARARALRKDAPQAARRVVAGPPVAAQQRAPREGVEGDVGWRGAELQRRLDKRGAEDARDDIRLREQREVEQLQVEDLIALRRRAAAPLRARQLRA
eukprot:5395031-Prymnesium_polylepis.1